VTVWTVPATVLRDAAEDIRRINPDAARWLLHRAATLDEHTDPARAMGRHCAVHTHREDVPLEVHHIWPLGEGGPDTKANKVTVCSNGHGSIHDLLAKIKKAGSVRAVPWPVRRRYGWRIRGYATLGWVQMQGDTDGVA
jgi:hypothetical protein